MIRQIFLKTLIILNGSSMNLDLLLQEISHRFNNVAARGSKLSN